MRGSCDILGGIALYDTFHHNNTFKMAALQSSAAWFKGLFDNGSVDAGVLPLQRPSMCGKEIWKTDRAHQPIMAFTPTIL